MTQPIVFVHGAFCGGWAFETFKKPFAAAGFDTHAPNLPAHDRGADLEHLATLGVREYAEALIRFIHTFDAPPVLVGHSLGGLVCQIAAGRTEVAGLVLLCSSAPWGVMPTTLDEHGANFGLTLLGDYWRRPIPPDYRVARNSTLDRLEREAARRVFAKFVPESGKAVLETVQWWLDPSMASAAPAFKVTAPILAITGGADRVNPASTVRRIVNRYPQAQADYREFPLMSHWPMAEPEADDVAGEALAWLAARSITPQVSAKPKRRALRLFGWGEQA
jgi:pimeloyl-ACP methyl ester carboxylesterase